MYCGFEMYCWLECTVGSKFTAGWIVLKCRNVLLVRVYCSVEMYCWLVYCSVDCIVNQQNLTITTVLVPEAEFVFKRYMYCKLQCSVPCSQLRTYTLQQYNYTCYIEFCTVYSVRTLFYFIYFIVST